MKPYSLIVIFIFICCICEYTLVEIIPKLKRNILSFCYGINFKYEGMLAHSFDIFYVVAKFILPSINDLNILPIDFDSKCSYLDVNLRKHHNANQYVSNLKMCCEIIVPFIDYYKEQITSYNHTAHKVLTNEISMILPTFPKGRKEKRGIITPLVTGFISLVYEEISSYLHKKDKRPCIKHSWLWKIK